MASDACGVEVSRIKVAVAGMAIALFGGNRTIKDNGHGPLVTFANADSPLHAAR
jgi:hypothetical protein